MTEQEVKELHQILKKGNRQIKNKRKIESLPTDAVNTTVSVSGATPNQIKLKQEAAYAKSPAAKQRREEILKQEKEKRLKEAMKNRTSIGPDRRTVYEINQDQEQMKIIQDKYPEMFNKARAITNTTEEAKRLAGDVKNWNLINSEFKKQAGIQTAAYLPLFATGPGLLAYTGGQAFDFGTLTGSEGKYQNWGQFAEQTFGIPEGYGQITNPGYALSFRGVQQGLGKGLKGTSQILSGAIKEYPRQIAAGTALSMPMLAAADDGDSNGFQIGFGIGMPIASLIGGAWLTKKGYNYIYKKRNNAKKSNNSTSDNSTSDKTSSNTVNTTSENNTVIPEWSPSWKYFTWERPDKFARQQDLAINNPAQIRREWNQAVKSGNTDNFKNKYNLNRQITVHGEDGVRQTKNQLLTDDEVKQLVMNNEVKNTNTNAFVIPRTTVTQDLGAYGRNTLRLLTPFAIAGAGYGLFSPTTKSSNKDINDVTSQDTTYSNKVQDDTTVLSPVPLTNSIPIDSSIIIRRIDDGN